MANGPKPRVDRAKNYTILWIDFPLARTPWLREVWGNSASVLAMHNFTTFDPAGGVARIHHQLGLLHDAAIVVIGVVGHDDDAIVIT
jgi:hypothetical protein